MPLHHLATRSAARRQRACAWRASICAAVGVLALTFWAPPGAAQSRPRHHRIAIEYKTPENPELRRIKDALAERRVLENTGQLLSPLRLPRRLTLRLSDCDGDANAFYENDAITVCYEYIARLIGDVFEHEPKGTTRFNLLVGATADVFFHEAGHAVFDMLEIPVFGREEDAADQFSAYILLNFAKTDARHLIFGAAFALAKDAQRHQSEAKNLDSYADEHGLPAQRFFNYICLGYGFDPTLFAAALDQGKLPKDRAERCQEEYGQVDRAFKKLIAPHVNKRALARVRARQWFNLDPVE